MSSTRKIEGLARTWEEPIGIHKAAFCEGTSKVREGLGYTPSTLIIGGKAFTDDEVRTMLEEMMATSNCTNGYRIKRDAVRSIAAKHGITP